MANEKNQPWREFVAELEVISEQAVTANENESPAAKAEREVKAVWPDARLELLVGGIQVHARCYGFLCAAIGGRDNYFTTDEQAWLDAASKLPKAQEPVCNGPFGDEEDCPVHGYEFRKARGKLPQAQEPLEHDLEPDPVPSSRGKAAAPTIGTEHPLGNEDLRRLAECDWCEIEEANQMASELLTTRKELASAIAERDKAVELLREYRRMHEYSDVFEHQNDSETCSTCLKLDASGLLGGK